MFVNKMLLDTSEGQRPVSQPGWAEIQKALRSLDGKNVTLVSLSGEGEANMAVGGGENGQYIAYATFDNWTFHNLVDPSRPEDRQVTLVTGGQSGVFSARQCVDLSAVLAAAKTFVDAGELERSVHWQEG
jgi:hypothetical protein